MARMRILIPLLVLFMLSACSNFRVDPKQHPQAFDVQAWAGSEYRGNGHFVSNGPAELNAILIKDFPTGTPRAEVEKYLLASGELKPSNEAKLGPAAPDRKIGGEYMVFYLKERLNCTFGIIAVYGATSLLVKPPGYSGGCDGL